MINLVVTPNDKYCPYVINLLKSINKHHSKYRIYIIFQDLNKKNIEALQENNKSNMKFIRLNKRILCERKILKNLTEETFFRLFIHKVLPTNIRRVIYLDCDTVIKSSLEELWLTDLKNKSIAGVRDISSKIKNKECYINAGVLLIDLKKYQENIKKIKNIDKLIKKMNDQEIINNLFKNKILYLDESFNVQYWSCMFRSTQKKPVILHYTWDLKPGQSLYPNFFQNKEYIDKNKKINTFLHTTIALINWIIFRLPYDTVVLMSKKYNKKIGILVTLLMPQALVLKLIKIMRYNN